MFLPANLPDQQPTRQTGLDCAIQSWRVKAPVPFVWGFILWVALFLFLFFALYMFGLIVVILTHSQNT